MFVFCVIEVKSKPILLIQYLGSERNNNIFIISVLAHFVQNFKDFVVW